MSCHVKFEFPALYIIALFCVFASPVIAVVHIVNRTLIVMYTSYVDVIIINENRSLTLCHYIHHLNHYLLHQAAAGSKVGG